MGGPDGSVEGGERGEECREGNGRVGEFRWGLGWEVRVE